MCMHGRQEMCRQRLGKMDIIIIIIIKIDGVKVSLGSRGMKVDAAG